MHADAVTFASRMAMIQQERVFSLSKVMHLSSPPIVSSASALIDGLKQIPHSVGARNCFLALSVQ